MRKLLLLIGWLGVCVPVANSAPIYLSDYLGVPSGEVAFSSNSPYMTVLEPNGHGFGADRPGNYSSTLIEFVNSGVSLKGIGMHPNQAGTTRIEFDLNQIRLDSGPSFDTFHALVGIDATAAPNSLPPGGVVFEVFLDGALSAAETILEPEQVPVAIALSLTGVQTLGLQTSRTGLWHRNHGVWADASLIPEPTTALLLGLGLVGLAVRQRG